MSEFSEFQKNGYSLIRGLLTCDEIASYRQLIREIAKIDNDESYHVTFECPDGVSRYRQFWPLIYDARLVGCIRELLGVPNVKYTQHSDLHANRSGGWHRDCACRRFGVGPDWNESSEPYKVVRVAIYLQTYAESGSSLGVVPGSHRFEKRITDREWREWIRRKKGSIPKRIAQKLGFLPSCQLPERKMTMWTSPDYNPRIDDPSFPVWIRTEPGDCVVFDQRLFHSASPIHGPKYAIYLSYSPENQHARNHMGYYRHFRQDLAYGDLAPELAKKLQEHDLFLAAPPPECVDGFFANGAGIA